MARSRAREVQQGRRSGGMRGARTASYVELVRQPSLAEVVALNALGAGWRLLRTAVLHPRTSVAVLVPAWAVAAFGVELVATAAAVVVTALQVWCLGHGPSFMRFVGVPVRTSWRRVWVYRRRWQPTLAVCGLLEGYGDATWVPRIRRVRSTGPVDSLLVDLLSGQAVEDWETKTPALAQSFGAHSCRVRVDRPGRLWLDFEHTDALATVVPAIPPAGSVDKLDLTAVPVGRRADGKPWALPLLGSHVLVAGATGSGKGSVFWSLLQGLSPAIAEGSVQVWAVDPKGGMELAPGDPLFARFACDDQAAMVELLEDAAAVMQSRARRLRGVTRLHAPTVVEPLVVVLVDELAALTAYVTDRDLKRRTHAVLQLLLSQGRAVGVLVVAALQDPGKDVLPFRDLFPVRVALRLVEDDQVAMVLGPGARQRGAECDRIPPAQPGTGYMLLDGQREPTRVRAAYLDDPAIAQLTASMPAQLRPAVTPAGVPAVDLDPFDRAGPAARRAAA